MRLVAAFFGNRHAELFSFWQCLRQDIEFAVYLGMGQNLETSGGHCWLWERVLTHAKQKVSQ